MKIYSLVFAILFAFTLSAAPAKKAAAPAIPATATGK